MGKTPRFSIVFHQIPRLSVYNKTRCHFVKSFLYNRNNVPFMPGNLSAFYTHRSLVQSFFPPSSLSHFFMEMTEVVKL